MVVPSGDHILVTQLIAKLQLLEGDGNFDECILREQLDSFIETVLDTQLRSKSDSLRLALFESFVDNQCFGNKWVVYFRLRLVFEMLSMDPCFANAIFVHQFLDRCLLEEIFSSSHSSLLLAALYSLYNKLELLEIKYPSREDVIAKAISVLSCKTLTCVEVCNYLTAAIQMKKSSKLADSIAKILLSADFLMIERVAKILLSVSELISSVLVSEIFELARQQTFAIESLCALVAKFVLFDAKNERILLSNEWKSSSVRNNILMKLIISGRMTLIAELLGQKSLNLHDLSSLCRFAQDKKKALLNFDDIIWRGISFFSSNRKTSSPSCVADFIESIPNPSEAVLDAINQALMKNKLVCLATIDSLLKKSELWRRQNITKIKDIALIELDSCSWEKRDDALEILRKLVEYGSNLDAANVTRIRDMAENDEYAYVRETALKLFSEIHAPADFSFIASRLVDPDIRPRLAAANILLKNLPQTSTVCGEVVERFSNDDDVELQQTVIKISEKLIAGKNTKNENLRQSLVKFKIEHDDCYNDIDQALANGRKDDKLATNAILRTGEENTTKRSIEKMRQIITALSHTGAERCKECYDA